MHTMIRGFGMAALASSMVLAASTASAVVMRNVNFDPGAVGSQGQSYSSGVLDFDEGAAVVNAGEEIQIWIFFDQNKHIELIEDPGGIATPDEEFTNLQVFGSSGATSPNSTDVQIELSGVMGELDVPNPFSTQFDCDQNGCNAPNIADGDDLTDTSVLFHDIHIHFINPLDVAMTIDSVQFDLGGSEIRIDVWEMPEPGTFAVLGFGLLAMGYLRRRREAA